MDPSSNAINETVCSEKDVDEIVRSNLLSKLAKHKTEKEKTSSFLAVCPGSSDSSGFTCVRAQNTARQFRVRPFLPGSTRFTDDR